MLNYSVFIMLNTQYLKNYFLIASWYTTLIRVVTFSVSQCSRSISHVSPPVRESKAVLDSGFHDVDSWFQVLNSDSLSVELGFRIPIVSGFLDSLNCIPDSKAQDSGFRILWAKISLILDYTSSKTFRIKDSRFPYIEKQVTSTYATVIVFLPKMI